MTLLIYFNTEVDIVLLDDRLICNYLKWEILQRSNLDKLKYFSATTSGVTLTKFNFEFAILSLYFTLAWMRSKNRD
jgi:hypothetical protein